MKQPQIDLIPIRPAVRTDIPITLDVLVRIAPPAPEMDSSRPPINLGLVLDRSGSMGDGNKMVHAREAACYAVQQLLPSDRISVTLFDNVVETIVPSTPVEGKQAIIRHLRDVKPRGSTALHDGWREGANQVLTHLLPGGLNRVLLLSDGLANVGETRIDPIASHVHSQAGSGVSTTTLGVGDDYNEHLLEAMANSGDGNYYHVESPAQLPGIFETELRGLMATHGTAVSLGLEPQGNVSVSEVLNELERTPRGRHRLPNLVAGMPILVSVRLHIPPQTEERDLCQFRLAWTDPHDHNRHRLLVSLSLPPVSEATWIALAANLEVQEQATLQTIARFKKQAAQCAEQRDAVGARRWLEEAQRALADVPVTVEVQNEMKAMEQLATHLENADYTKFGKHGKYQAHRRRRSQGYDAEEPNMNLFTDR